ncbi:hypothetical protein [Flavobacterium hibernum]|uniref:DUF4595 domain-containing protein n=1 Tax=Flavobacterium hibernum TaxID=37752 RepID=A0A0D0EXD5_9FLAO|nr:hypothetical protein [Flavobacterium hibernum]KIO51866.1 hypothetical protein IW18_16600 [Flavobacterium hibernum]OXA84257.1 hypothetical protein B0A73_20480 [Flavobacterium hibernum]STO18954.1 Uncharacterised protein [Flavobacterium hibernum]
MKKTLLLILLISSIAYCQKNKPQIESIEEISNYYSETETTSYKFENGKLVSKNVEKKLPTYFSYNQKGLLEKESNTYNDGDIQDVYYTYNDNGYLIGIIRTGKKNGASNFKPWGKTVITYNIKDANHYIVESSSGNIDFSGNIDNSKYVQKNTFEMKGNILKKTTNEGSYKYIMQNGNMINIEQESPSKFNHSVDYKFDNSESVNKIIAYNMFGDKYFITSLVCQPPLFDFYTDFVNENNSIESKNAKINEYLRDSENTSFIVYNEQKLPTEIKTENNHKQKKLIKIKYH